MKRNQRLILALMSLCSLCLFGCPKGNEPVKDSVTAIETDAKASAGAGAPKEALPPAAQGQMGNALNDPNTPPEVKAKIRAQMGGGGQ